MRKRILTLAAAVLFGSALAQTSLSLVFDDAEFPYYDLDKGYISLSLEGDTLTVHLTENAAGGEKLSFAKKIKQPTEESVGEFAGAGDLTTDSERELRKLSGLDVTQNTVEINHLDVDLSDVIDAYSAMLTDLGFARSTDATYPNTRIYLFEHQGQLARVFFTRFGTDVRVRLTTVI